MAWAGAPSPRGVGLTHVPLDGLEAGVRSLDPGSRALLDLSLRHRLRDDDMAPLLRIDAFNLAWRRARVLERLASGLGLADPTGLAQVRAALPHIPETAWGVPPALGPGPAPVEQPVVVEGSAETIEFDAIVLPDEHRPAATPEHAWGPRALAVQPPAPSPVPAPAPRRVTDAIAAARGAAAGNPAARGALLAGAGALLGALLSRRRR